MRKLLPMVCALILASPAQAVVVAATSNAGGSAAQAAANATRVAANASVRQETVQSAGKPGFVTCGKVGKNPVQYVRNLGCAEDVDDSAFSVRLVETPYAEWPGRAMGLKNYKVTGIAYDHYNGVTTVYFEYW